jgi:ribosomal protein S18 acetylase RimI-like enzyme
MKTNIRRIKSSDYSEISNLANNSYPEYLFESEESFFSKLEKFPEGCFVADLDGIIGYIISFPYIMGKYFPINSIFEIVEDPDCWYIHDLCVSKDFRKRGIGEDLTKEVLKNSWGVVCLTAVEGSSLFWHKMGFRSFFKVDYNGSKADYMILIK